MSSRTDEEDEIVGSWSKVEAQAWDATTPQTPSPIDKSSVTSGGSSTNSARKTHVEGGFVVDTDYIPVASPPQLRTEGKLDDSLDYLSKVVKGDVTKLDSNLRREFAQIIGGLESRLDESLQASRDNEVMISVLQSTVERLTNECSRLRSANPQSKGANLSSSGSWTAGSNSRPTAGITVTVPSRNSSGEDVMDSPNEFEDLRAKKDFLKAIDTYNESHRQKSRMVTPGGKIEAFSVKYSDTVLRTLPMDALVRLVLEQMSLEEETMDDPYSNRRSNANRTASLNKADETRETPKQKKEKNKKGECKVGMIVSVSVAFVAGIFAGTWFNEAGYLDCFKGLFE